MAVIQTTSPVVPGQRTLRLETVGFALVLLACAIFMFVDVRTPPIMVWDEARLAVSALEMRARGPGLVATYDFAPDLWNTKPPLLVWLMYGAMAVFGPTEFAVRLPSMLASMGTLAIVFVFTRRLSHSFWTAALAAAVLALSVGFFGEHGARTGDYDALLTFFTTAYLSAGFAAIHQARPSAGLLLATGALVAAAILTKSVAGLVPGAGLFAYAVATRRLRRLLWNPWTYAAALVALAPPVLFYVAREAAAPGYLAAVWANDVSGRFLTTLETHAGPPWYYLAALFAGWLFSVGPLALISPFGLAAASGKARIGLLFALCAAGATLLVVSAGATKLPQYLLPALPFLAVAVALAAFVAVRATRRSDSRPASRLVVGMVLALTALAGVRAAYFRAVVLPERQFHPQALYGELLAGLAAGGASGVHVVETGLNQPGAPPNYAPHLRFYALAWRERGVAVTVSTQPRTPPSGVVLASCDPAHQAWVGRSGPRLEAPAGCMAVRPPAAKFGATAQVRGDSL